MPSALVLGLAQTGEAVARQLLKREWDVVVADDRPTDTTRSSAAALGLPLVESPDPGALDAMVRAADVVLPAPGVPSSHPVFALAPAAGAALWSEFELVAHWPHPPFVAITGTNGKTTVTTMVTLMLQQAGRRVVAAGNNELPLVDAVDRASADALDVIVVEASSYRLELTETFRPEVGVWLNLAEDHLDWHGSMDRYGAAKAKIWAHQRDSDVAIANADDPLVLRALQAVPSQAKTYSIAAPADGCVVGDDLVVDGDVLAPIGALPRSWPHDIGNGLAASLAAMSAGADRGSCRHVLETFRGLPHRVQLIGDAGGVRFYDDSKSTTPASVLTAVAGFDSVVLIAGGRNKGLDLGALASGASRIKAVVAIGESAGAVEAAFSGRRPVVTATSMDEAVKLASERAEAGDVVLLSPGCASQDWYRNYAERGDDFARAVAELGGAR
jgi:UDP-N-acetylmuramoylalanine--D-glutamate ligase